MAKKEEILLWLRLKDGISSTFGVVTTSVEKNLKALKESSIIFAGAFAGVIAGIFTATKAFEDSQAVAAQTESVLKSTGMAAGMTAKSVNELAIALQNKTGIDDDVIQSGENMLLTFTNIKKNAFEPATKAALDMTAAFNQGKVTQENLQGTIIQLGKALNDPTQGMTALRRVGVAFTEQQQEQIKALQASGNLFEAQQMILKEIQKEFGGASEKLSTLRGAFTMAKTQAGNFMELLGEQLAPIFKSLAEFISSTSIKLMDFVKTHKELIVPVTASITVFTGLIAALTGIITIAPEIAAAWVVITGPIGITVAAIAGLTAATVYFSTSQSKLAENVRAVWTGIRGIYTGNIDKIKSAWKDLSESSETHNKKIADDTKKRAAEEAEAVKRAADAAKAAEEQKIIDQQAAIEKKNKLEADEREAKKQADEEEKAAKLQAEIDYGQALLSQDEEFISQKAELEQIAEDARKQFEEQKKQFDKMSASDRLKLLTDTLGKEKILKTTASIDELVAKGKHEEAKKAIDQLYHDAFVQINKDTIKTLDEEWRKHWDAQIAMAIFGKDMTKEQYNQLGNFFSNLMELMGRESLASFRLMQASAISETLIKTYESAQLAFTSLAGIPIIGPALGATAAGVAVAAGLARVDQIRRQEPPKAETGAYVKTGGLAELHDQEMVLNKEQTAALAAGIGVQHIYLQINRETLQSWIINSDEESERMNRLGVR